MQLEPSPIQLKFLGGAGTVTGSKILLKTELHQVLIDCGLFQGLKQLRLLNWQKPPLSIPDLDAIILTHGHLDHCGYLPVLAKNGYDGPIYATEPTREVSASLEVVAASAPGKGRNRSVPGGVLF